MPRPNLPRQSGPPPPTSVHAHGEDEQPNEVRQSMSSFSRGRGRVRGRGPGPSVPTSSYFNQNSRARQGHWPNMGKGGGRTTTLIATPNSGDPPPPRPRIANASSSSAEASTPARENRSAATSSPSDVHRTVQNRMGVAASGAQSLSASGVTSSSISPSTHASTSEHMHPERSALLDMHKSRSHAMPSSSTIPDQTNTLTSASSVASTSPTIKREKSASPPLEEPEYSCMGRIHLPLPNHCRRIEPAVKANRNAWKAKEIEALSRLGLTAKPEIIRDDGMSIIWESPTPVRLVAEGSSRPLSASEFKLLHPPTVVNTDQTPRGQNLADPPSSEIIVDVPRFLRDRAADDHLVMEWMNIEAEQLRSMEGATILKSSLLWQEQQLTLHVILPRESPSIHTRQRRRRLDERNAQAATPLTENPAEIQFPIPPFIRDDIKNKNRRGKLWLRVQVDSAEQTYGQSPFRQYVQKDVLHISFTPAPDQIKHLETPEQNAVDVDRNRTTLEQSISVGHKRKRSPVEEPERVNARRMLTPNEATRRASASITVVDEPEVEALPTPAPTQADEDEEYNAVRSLGLRFLETYFRAFDGDRELLKDAYVATATFSYQLHDLPLSVAQGSTTKVLDTFVRRDGHRNLIYASHRHGSRAQHDLHKILKVGSTAILAALSEMGTHVHGYSAPFIFDIRPLAEHDNLYTLVAHGDILHAMTREACSYTQVFVLKKPDDEAGQWPLSILSQQFTIRPKMH